IIETAGLVILRQNHRSCDNRSCERRHSSFVYSGNKRVALGPQVNLKAQQRVQALTFRTVAAIPLTNSLRKLMSSRARVNLQRLKEVLRYRPSAFEKQLSQF